MSIKFNIIFRACDIVEAVNKSPRPFGLNKREIIKICFKSVVEAVKPLPHTIIVLGDKLSDEITSYFSSFNVKIINGDFGNDASIRASIEQSLQFPDDEWVYFCEDDYLHHPDSFYRFTQLIENKSQLTIRKKKLLSKKYISFEPDLVIHPPDYPDRYLTNQRKPSYIFLTDDYHWRQISNTTFTFLTRVSTVKKHYKTLIKSSYGANDAYLSEHLYGNKSFKDKCLCLSPIHGLANHMHVDTFTPCVNWEDIFLKYRHLI
jgi:hypothetical protein